MHALYLMQKDIRAKKKGIESELSIFAPHGTELVPGGKENEIIMERPVTPIDVSKTTLEISQHKSCIFRFASRKVIDFSVDIIRMSVHH